MKVSQVNDQIIKYIGEQWKIFESVLNGMTEKNDPN